VVVKSRARDLQTLSAWIEAGRLVPLVDRSFALEDVQQAHAYIETKRARGKVVLKLF
jgi:NADPH:quinone reductase-like Zn-dependent oxidoreductase